ncbi:tripartite tricarboxylate transporter substrate binding protein [Curvibacter sp. RS43]|uniref:Bug family tripartite tricarboxylate transporter substrate binding protein n=1 Tax=Curvibacter microcysteis TaxID=3026419 RepID=UPI00236248C2|nr:tripartite tricarboxylate transporter substrate binding protein [Curvibacter sp. RS43]MDD0809461.1 tripartite tricarboxylate transporter substrate binding protein [Curvibacter sp. RS43]
MSHLKPSHADNRRQFIAKSLGTLALGLPLASQAQSSYPDRPITFICPWPAGGTADVTMRALCSAAAKQLGQSVVVENKAGAAGMLGAKALASAKPDGYTVGQIPISVTRFSQLGTVALDPLKDLSYLARTSGQTFGIVVHSDAPWKSLKELVAAAKAKPGELTYGSAGVAGATHVGMEEFALAAGVQLNHIPYKGGAPALQDLLGGQLNALADSTSWAPYVKAGKLRLLATWGEKRTQDFPEAPTLKELGYNVVVDAPNGVGAPKGLEPAIEKRLREAFRQAAASVEFATACDRIDAPLMYLDGPDYARYVSEVYRRETQLIERLKLKELLAKG